MTPRKATAARKTQETDIEVTVDLDGTGRYQVVTPIGFLTHMVEQIARHGALDLEVNAQGDVHIDGHHTTEDLGITLGQAVSKALGTRAGIRRYGSAMIPMDEAFIQCAMDLSGRPHLVFNVPLPKARIGDFDAELTEVFFDGFCRGAGCNLHLHLARGQNLHHMIEVSFKSFARALRAAVELDPRAPGVPSTKGTLTE